MMAINEEINPSLFSSNMLSSNDPVEWVDRCGDKEFLLLMEKTRRNLLTTSSMLAQVIRGSLPPPEGMIDQVKILCASTMLLNGLSLAMYPLLKSNAELVRQRTYEFMKNRTVGLGEAYPDGVPEK